MHRFLWVGTFWIAVSFSSVSSAQAPDAPGPPPAFAMVAKVDAATRTLDLVYTVSKPVYETKTVVREVNGQSEEVQVTVEHMVSESRLKQVRLDSLRVVTAGKTRLSTDTALERLEPGQFVLLHRSSGKFDSRYLSLLAPSTLILLETPGETPAPAPSAPTPFAPVPAPPAPPKPVPATAVPGPT